MPVKSAFYRLTDHSEIETISSKNKALAGAYTGGMSAVSDIAIAPSSDKALRLREPAAMDGPAITRLIADCAEGHRDADNGRVIYIRRAEDASVEIKVQPRIREA